MVNKCCVVGCGSNCKGEEIVPVFSFPSDEDIKNRWIKLITASLYITAVIQVTVRQVSITLHIFIK